MKRRKDAISRIIGDKVNSGERIELRTVHLAGLHR